MSFLGVFSTVAIDITLKAKNLAKMLLVPFRMCSRNKESYDQQIEKKSQRLIESIFELNRYDTKNTFNKASTPR